MSDNLIKEKVALRISGPWELGEQLGWQELEAVILRQDNVEGIARSILIKLVHPFVYKGNNCEYFVAHPRYEGENFTNFQVGKPLFCGFTKITFESYQNKNPFDLSSWRGGVALIGDIERK